MLACITLSIITCSTTPRLTIAFIVDQLAYHYLEKIEPHLTGGISFLLKNGTVYKNAFMPNAHPCTSTGHVTIDTGTYAKTHGIVGNSWLDDQGNKENFEKIAVDHKYAVLSNKSTNNYAIAGTNIMTDGISDQFVLHSKPNATYKVFGLAQKVRSAVGVSGSLGKAIWFDTKKNQFTSSKAYFEQLPEWVTSFNNEYLTIEIPKVIEWQLFNKNPLPYQFYDVKNYKFTNYPFSIINTPFDKLTLPSIKEYADNGAETIYIKTPHSNKHLLELAKRCLDNNLSNNPNDKIFLWILLGSLDPLGHYYGPQSQEALDLLYHLDWQIKQFMEYVEKKVKANDILYVLTSDHGVMPIIENLKERGMKNIHRIDEQKILQELNEHIKKTHNIENLIVRHLVPQFYVNKKLFYGLPKEKRAMVSHTIKTFLQQQPGIMRVWTYNELNSMPVEPGSIDSFFKNQLYPGRSGEFTCKCNPYSAITKYPRGTHHRTPYEYDTHVPLSIYQKGTTKKQVIEKKVFMTQLANTLAKLLNVTKPSASVCEPLPGV